MNNQKAVMPNRTGLSWGFRDLNKITLGLHPAEMVVIASRPGVGKTSLALNVAEKLVLEEKIPIGIFSLEMTAHQLALRMASSKARINTGDLYYGDISKKLLRKFTRAADMIGSSPLHVIDKSQMNINQLRVAARRLKKREHIEVLIVDYLQLMVGAGRNGNRERKAAMISSGLKALTKELNISVIVLSQLNSEPKQKGNRLKPVNRLGWSAIERDADIVCLLTRKDSYDEEGDAAMDAITAEVIIAKNRNGATGKIKLTFFPKYTRFEDSTETKN